MNRLTNEFIISNIENGFHLDDEHLKFLKDKLEYADKMKSIEEELEIDFIKVYKALKQGYVYSIYIDSNFEEKIQAFPIEGVFINKRIGILRTKYEDLGLKGKTWALTREELEND